MNNDRIGTPINILLREDYPSDVRLTIEAFKDCKVHNKMSVVEVNMEAVAFLRKEGIYTDAVSPNLILLDLKLPKKHGQGVLTEIKKAPKLKSIPVAILTTSEAESDIAKTYEVHANCYITKPVDLEQFISALKCIDHIMANYCETATGLNENHAK